MKQFVLPLLLVLALAACTTAAEQKAADEKKCEG
ncbi:MAG: lipoprotein [Alphaproteobacteria bacterium]|nr:lipoprotein [Alphaproteobacteria bacterium]